MDLTGYIRDSWNIYKKYALEFILCFVLMYVVPGFIFLFGGFMFLLFLFSGMGAALPSISQFVSVSNATNLGQLISAGIGVVGSILAGLALLIPIIIIAIIVGISLQGAFYSLAYNSTKNKKPTIDDLFAIARKKWATFFGITIVVGLINLIAIAVLGSLFIPFAVAIPTSLNATGSGIGMIIAPMVTLGIAFVLGLILINMLMSLSLPAAVVDNLGAIDAVKASIGTVKENFVDFLLLTVLFSGFYVMSMMAYVFGILISMFVITPIFIITLTRFYADKRKKVR